MHTPILVLLISFSGIQFSSCPQTVDHNIIAGNQSDRRTSHLVTLCHYVVRSPTRTLHSSYPYVFLQFVTTANSNCRPADGTHRNTSSSFRSPFGRLAVTLKYLWIGTAKQQDKQCTYNVTLRGVRVTVFVVEK
jgi:hypothetical protein